MPRSHPTSPRLPSLLATGLAVLLPLAACGDDPDPTADAATDEPAADEPAGDESTGDESTGDGASIPVVLDYSPTVSDAGALLHLAAHPDVDLLAVTLPSTGEADCAPGVRTTRALLTIAGRGDVPVGCGAEVPAAGRNEWPAEWRAAANHLTGVVLPGVVDVEPHDAGELLRDVLRAADAPVTVVAVGPLTNLDLLLEAEPALADRIERIVTMGGAVDVPGNVESAPAAEWNFHVDPAAARAVLGSGVDVLVVPLDATDDVPWTTTLISRIATSSHPVARAEHQIVSAADLDGIYLWDELAAVAALDPAVVTVEQMTLAVDAAGALVRDPAGAVVTVATAADVDAATDALLTSLNGGEPPRFEPLTADETAYYTSLATAFGELEHRLDELEPPPTATPHELARLLVETMWSLLDEISAQLDAATPPASVDERHAAFADTIEGTLALESDLLDAIDRAEGDDPWMLLQAALDEIDPALTDRLVEACGGLEEHAVVRGGPELCGLFGE